MAESAASPAIVTESARTRLLAPWPRIASPYPAASVLALGLANAVDVGVQPGPRDSALALFLIGLVLGLGCLHGLLWQALQAGLARLPRWLALAVWPAASLCTAALLAERLGGITRLGGRYHLLAVIVLAGCAAGALALAGLLAGMQPTARAPRGFLRGLGRPGRLAIGGALLVAAVAIDYADHSVYVGLYADAHVALRLVGVWLLMFALVLCDAELSLPRLSPAWTLALACWTAAPLILLDERSPRALQGFGVRAWPSMLLGYARALADFDGDGHSGLLGGGDCAPFNPRVHPRAREIPDNGIDDNCVLGDARRTALAAVDELPMPTTPSRLDVVVITIDALRPDHLGIYNPAYGPKGRATTPRLDRFAAKSTIFRRAYTAGAWTSIAIPSMMRGLYPRKLRWTRYYETNLSAMLRAPLKPKLRRGEQADRIFPFAFDDPRAPLALRLQRRGMYTAAVVDDGYSEILRPGIGVERGFDAFYEVDNQPLARRNDKGTVELAVETLAHMPKGKRFFLWVHLFGPHGPDEFHVGTRVYGSTAPDLYDHEIAFLDEQLQHLLKQLERRSAQTAVFVTADHGEMLHPNVRYHGHTLDESVIRIPLIARVPGWPAGNVDGMTSLIDLVPTVLALTETPIPNGLDGRDLADMAKGAPAPARILLSDTWRFDAGGKKELDFVAAYDGHQKVVLDRANHYVIDFDRGHALGAVPGGEGFDADTLSRAIYGYIDDTGGELQLGD